MVGVPEIIGNYRVVRELGSGAFGHVYEARHLVTSGAAAVKILHAHRNEDERVRRRLTDREAVALKAVRHPNVLPILELGEHESAPYLATELVHGGSAEALESASSSLGPMLALGADLFEGLAAIHTANYVHRDIKPANLLMRSRTPAHVGVISDFGLARCVGEERSLTTTGRAGGTPIYASPEELDDFKHAGRASDLYSAAATVYRLLTRRAVFDISNVATLSAFVRAAQERERVPLVRLRPDVPSHVAAAIDALVTINPGHREAADPAEIATMLRAACS